VGKKQDRKQLKQFLISLNSQRWTRLCALPGTGEDFSLLVSSRILKIWWEIQIWMAGLPTKYNCYTILNPCSWKGLCNLCLQSRTHVFPKRIEILKCFSVSNPSQESWHFLPHLDSIGSTPLQPHQYLARVTSNGQTQYYAGLSFQGYLMNCPLILLGILSHHQRWAQPRCIAQSGRPFSQNTLCETAKKSNWVSGVNNQLKFWYWFIFRITNQKWSETILKQCLKSDGGHLHFNKWGATATELPDELPSLQLRLLTEAC